MSAEGDGVSLELTPELRARGLEGAFARARIEGPVLRVAGDRTGGFNLPLDSIERLRVGVTGGRRSSAEARIWAEGEAEPLLLRARRNQESYAPLMRRLAAAVVAERGVEAVESGTTRRAAIGHALYWWVQLALFLAAAFYFYAEGFWFFSVGFVLLSLVAVPVFAEIRWTMLPRRLRAIEELERVLPKVQAQPGKARSGM